MIARPDFFAVSSPRTVLVVDDVGEVLRWLARVFRRGGWRVLAADSGDAALAAWTREEEEGRAVDLLVTDLAMPGMDGHALADALWRQAPTLPVLALTGREDRRDRWRRTLHPGSAVLLKPVHPDVLRDAAERLVAGAGV
ncbi:response regulator [Roseisolibacter sp. H3M3-2]|uniref:response regulator n=1 Tax=Roseisolibacter sp. H3M3-2 TaxID=3031323 RepID=UPI0023DB3B8A|nr:response regulator [Roseisolibacter sp. H3M3-2]MDF1501618.1 response regulator [Roseisolibacter sp. H3M3-2]